MPLQTPPRQFGLVADLDQVVGQRLDRLGGVSSLDTLAVVANEDSLRRLDRENTSAALYPKTYMVSLPFYSLNVFGIVARMLGDRRVETYLAAVQTPVLDLEHDISLTADVDTLSERLVGGTSSAGDDAGNVLHLLGFNLQMFDQYMISLRLFSSPRFSSAATDI